MDSYPKRLDLWFVYIDMETKQRNVEGVRALFERVLASRLSSSKSLIFSHSPFHSLLTHRIVLANREGQVCFQEVADFREGVWRRGWSRDGQGASGRFRSGSSRRRRRIDLAYHYILLQLCLSSHRNIRHRERRRDAGISFQD